jgi:hypothetical protein
MWKEMAGVCFEMLFYYLAGGVMIERGKPWSRHPVSRPRPEPETPEHEAGALLLNKHF